MNLHELRAQAQVIAPVVRGFVEQAEKRHKTELAALTDDVRLLASECKSLRADLVELSGRPVVDHSDKIKAIEARLKPLEAFEMPVFEQKEVDLEAITNHVIAQIDVNVPVDDIAPMVHEAVNKAIESLPKPEPVDYEVVKGFVTEVFQAIELPKDGKNAVDLEVLPAIDAEKSYPRGTYALHNGGLWRSCEKTVGMRGWECVVCGVADIAIEQGDDPRQVTVSLSKSDGHRVEKQFVFPVLIDCGVYKDEQVYRKGDGVSLSGSFWIAQVDSPAGRPGTTSDWRLSVKKGRDGRNA